jgi:hypothetical protein
VRDNDTIFLESLYKNVKNGLSQGMRLEDIAKKHDVDLASIKKELNKGIEVEKEHTSSEEEARKIAMDHLVEDPEYYTKLLRAGL